MSRCGCNPTCNCLINSGECTTVSGLGTPTNPYVVEVVVDNDSIVCGPNGLEANVEIVVDNDDAPDCVDVTVVENPTNTFTIAADLVIAPDQPGCSITLDASGNLGTNILRCIPGTGAGVFCEDIQDVVGAMLDVNAGDCLEYDDVTNSFNVVVCNNVNNGLECLDVGDGDCADGGLAVIPSADADNALTIGTDGRLYAAAGSTIAGDCIEITGTGTVPDPFVISVEVDPACPNITCGVNGLCVETVVNVIDNAQNINIAGTGTDTLTFTCQAVPVVTQVLTPNPAGCLSVAGNTCTGLTFSLGLSDDVCQGLECRADGLWAEEIPDDLTTGQLGECPGPIVLPVTSGGLVTYGATVTQTLTNTSQCRSVRAWVHTTMHDFGVQNMTGGVLELEAQFSINAGPFATWAQHIETGAFDGQFIVGSFGRPAIDLAPGAAVTIQSRMQYRTTGVTGPATLSGCQVLQIQGVAL